MFASDTEAEGAMRTAIGWVVLILCSFSVKAQTPEVNFIADTVVVQADGTVDASLDLARLTFRIFSARFFENRRTSGQLD